MSSRITTMATVFALTVMFWGVAFSSEQKMMITGIACLALLILLLLLPRSAEKTGKRNEVAKTGILHSRG